MPALLRLLSRASLLSLATLAGCALFSGDAWQRPSPLSGPAPPPPESQARREVQGGFTVLAEAPDYPSAARVAADIEAFAQRRGFVRQTARPAPQFDPATHQPLPPGPARYRLGGTVLDVAYQPADHRVVASLHSFKLDRKFTDQFYRDFDREYGGRYGEEDPIFENDFGDDASNPFAGGRSATRSGSAR